ncbi:MAG: glycosyltransferase family 4 protein [Armatimonadota bacterium]
MKIGIDARFLTHPQRGGFKSYTNAVVNALKDADHDNEYILYTDRPSNNNIDLPHNFTVKPVTASNGIIREQLLLPSVMQGDGIDLAHYPCNTAPIAKGPKMLVTILDAIPLRPQNENAGGMKHRLLSTYWRTVIPRCAHRAKMIVTCTNYTKIDLSDRIGLPIDKIRIVPLAVDPVFFNAAEISCPPEISPNEYYLLAFASSDPRKNHTSAIQAYRSIVQSYPGLKLVMVCAHKDVKTQIADSAPVGVLPIGPVKLMELLWLYRHAQVMIFPSFEEGFGLPPLEAMASGTPVVASNASCMPEVLGTSVVYADPSQPETIASGVHKIFSDDNLKRSLSIQGREHASRYNRENMGRLLVSAYSEALNGSEGTRR